MYKIALLAVGGFLSLLAFPSAFVSAEQCRLPDVVTKCSTDSQNEKDAKDAALKSTSSLCVHETITLKDSCINITATGRTNTTIVNNNPNECEECKAIKSQQSAQCATVTYPLATGKSLTISKCGKPAEIAEKIQLAVRESDSAGTFLQKVQDPDFSNQLLGAFGLDENVLNENELAKVQGGSIVVKDELLIGLAEYDTPAGKEAVEKTLESLGVTLSPKRQQALANQAAAISPTNAPTNPSSDEGTVAPGQSRGNFPGSTFGVAQTSTGKRPHGTVRVSPSQVEKIDSRFPGLRARIEDRITRSNVPQDALWKFMMGAPFLESGLDPNAAAGSCKATANNPSPNPNTCGGALGLYQFTGATWDQVMPGVPRSMRLNPHLSAEAAVRLAELNWKTIEPAVARSRVDGSAAIFKAHNIGAGNAARLLYGIANNPNAHASNFITGGAYGPNSALYNGTVAQALENIAARMSSDEIKRTGILAGNFGKGLLGAGSRPFMQLLPPAIRQLFGFSNGQGAIEQRVRDLQRTLGVSERDARIIEAVDRANRQSPGASGGLFGNLFGNRQSQAQQPSSGATQAGTQTVTPPRQTETRASEQTQTQQTTQTPVSPPLSAPETVASLILNPSSTVRAGEKVLAIWSSAGVPEGQKCELRIYGESEERGSASEPKGESVSEQRDGSYDGYRVPDDANGKDMITFVLRCPTHTSGKWKIEEKTITVE